MKDKKFVPRKQLQVGDCLIRIGLVGFQKQILCDNLNDPRIAAAFKDVAFYKQHVGMNGYWTRCTVPSRAKGKSRLDKNGIEKTTKTLQSGWKPFQPLIQAVAASKMFKAAHEDAINFYDADGLNNQSEEIQQAAFIKLSHALKGKAVVWRTASGSPKAAMWVRDLSVGECLALNRDIHAEVFGGVDIYAPARNHSDMTCAFAVNQEVLDAFWSFFSQAKEPIRAGQDTRPVYVEEIKQTPVGMEYLKASWGVEVVEEPVWDYPQHPLAASRTYEEGVEGEVEEGQTPSTPLAASRTYGLLQHNLSRPIYLGELPKSLFERVSLMQEIAIRYALSMPDAFLSDEGVALSSVITQKLAFEHYPDRFKPKVFKGKVDSSAAGKAINALVARGVMACASEDRYDLVSTIAEVGEGGEYIERVEKTTTNYVPGIRARAFRAVHPDLIELASKLIQERTPGIRGCATAVEAAALYLKVTGKRIEDTPLDGCSNETIFPLSSYCDSLEVFTDLCYMIPTFSDKEDRVARLPYQWAAHLRGDRRKTQRNIEGLLNQVTLEEGIQEEFV
jgi:hypothetical protein